MKKYSLKTYLKVGIIGGAVGFITLLHYQTSPDAGIRHVVFRELYFLPIILGGFWFGLRGGLFTAVTISLLYGPLILSEVDRFSAHNFGNIIEILLFNLVGTLLGWLRDRERAQLQRARKVESLAAMGQAAAMIAHDLKTPLVTIGGLARRLTYTLPAETPEGEKANVIRRQAERLEKLVMDILFFARPIKLSMKESDICHLLQKAKETVGEIAQTKEITINLPVEEKCKCALDDEKMMQVFVNLLSNAIEASSPGETVTISLASRVDTIIIDVSDRGSGIPENIIDRAIEPFVTGKKKGTGLGLPICRKIVEAHSGKLEFKNNLDVGVTFRIIIPAEH